MADLADATSLPSLERDMARVEAAVVRRRSDCDFIEKVATHLARAGGKRLRPLLVLLSSYGRSGGMVSGSDRVIAAAASVELLHLASLHHDDVMDDGDARRGVTSVNHRWGNTVAVLAGDLLLARAICIAAQLGAPEAMLVSSAFDALCMGQALEVAHIYDVHRTEKSYFSTVMGKTAALFTLSSRLGAIEGGLTAAQVETLSCYADNLGLAFQIVDDICDLEALGPLLDKDPGKDLENGIYTLPTILALRSDPSIARSLGRPISRAQAEQVHSLISATGAVNQAVTAAEDHVTKAVDALANSRHLSPAVVGELKRLAARVLDPLRRIGQVGDSSPSTTHPDRAPGDDPAADGRGRGVSRGGAMTHSRH
jgi:heptaprenyl diphosphate synthase